MHDFGVREVAQILGLTPRQVRRWVRDGLVTPARGPRGELRFDFQDLVILRTAKGLVDAKVHPRRLRRALVALRERLPRGRSLAEVQIALEGDELVVRDRSGAWDPLSGQAVFDFSVAELYARVAPIEGEVDPPPIDEDDDEHGIPLAWPANVSVLPTSSRPSGLRRDEGPPELDPDDAAAELDAVGWLEIADALEEDRRPAQARDALRRALELDPWSSVIRRRLGRVLEQEGRIDLAEAHLRLGRTLDPEDPELALHHGRMLAHLGEHERGLEAFEAAIALDPDLEGAYLGAADLHERLGDSKAALRILQEVRRRRRDPD